jgi:hypothetical protein
MDPPEVIDIDVIEEMDRICEELAVSESMDAKAAAETSAAAELQDIRREARALILDEAEQAWEPSNADDMLFDVQDLVHAMDRDARDAQVIPDACMDIGR